MTWHVLRVGVQREREVARAVEALGHAVYVPTEVRWTRGPARGPRARRKLTVPIVSRYAFASFARDIPWDDLRAVKGCEGVVMVDGRPGTIPNAVMQTFMAICRSFQGGQDGIHRSGREIRAGDKVEIVSGPFAAYTAAVETVHGNRAKVLVSLFRTTTTATIGLADLEAA